MATSEESTAKTAATASTGNSTNPNMVTIEVTVDTHRHAGKTVAKGSTITVHKDVASMLQASWKKQTESK